MTDEPFIAPSAAREACVEMAFLLRRSGPDCLGTTVDKYTSKISQMEEIARWFVEVERRRLAREAGARS
jgi:hypothetical protein